jgi:hypothetical protein
MVWKAFLGECFTLSCCMLAQLTQYTYVVLKLLASSSTV